MNRRIYAAVIGFEGCRFTTEQEDAVARYALHVLTDEGRDAWTESVNAKAVWLWWNGFFFVHISFSAAEWLDYGFKVMARAMAVCAPPKAADGNELLAVIPADECYPHLFWRESSQEELWQNAAVPKVLEIDMKFDELMREVRRRRQMD